MNYIPSSVEALASRYKTGQGHRGSSHEFHTLQSLSTRVLLSPAETLNVVSTGQLLSLDHRNGSHMFSASALDSIRNKVIDFISAQLCNELRVMGASEQEVHLAFEMAIRKQHELSRGSVEHINYFASNDDDDDDNAPFSNGVRQGAGLVTGAVGTGLTGLALYKYLKNRNQNGGNGPTPQLGNGSYLDVAPKSPTGGSGNAFPSEGAHPPAYSDDLTKAFPPKANLSPLPNATSNVAGVGEDLLTQAAKRGRATLAGIGSKAIGALSKFI